ncbi:SgcJ/EcaC family oxidoreductase [Arthrobacter sp. B0490]|uniref:YybH family protein n=1 Tax=Arthrobacter sp. B0490 TaxID=2058891 RepID=UPI000CE50B16|nr:SgcJ/EcaC family oxidoreductase [Arthrobacter sp. B0490]
MDGRTAVDAVLEGYAAAVLAKDRDGLVAHYSDDARVFDLWSTWSYEGRESWQGAIDEWFGSLGDQEVHVGFDDVRSVVTDDLATVSAIITYREVDDGGAMRDSLQNRLTWVLRRSGDTWRIIHEHTSAPIDGGTMKVILQR